jgi:hypothetical protein
MTCHVCHGHKILVYKIDGTDELTVGSCYECTGRISYEEFIGRYCRVRQTVKNSSNVLEMKRRMK